MVEHGARHSIYLSRSARQSDRDSAFLTELKSQGCSALALSGSVTDIAVLRQAVFMALMPIKGVFQLSIARSNKAFLNMSHSEWADVLAAKLDGTWYLHHELSRDMDFSSWRVRLGVALVTPDKQTMLLADTKRWQHFSERQCSYSREEFSTIKRLCRRIRVRVTDTTRVRQRRKLFHSGCLQCSYLRL